MKTTFESKIRSISKWSLIHLLIGIITIGIVVENNWLKKTCIDTFHKEAVINAYFYKAIRDSQNLCVIYKLPEVKKVLTKYGWYFDEKKGLVTYGKGKPIPTLDNIAQAYSIERSHVSYPDFFQYVILVQLENEHDLAQKVYASKSIHVDMKSWYKEPIDKRAWPIEVYDNITKEYDLALCILLTLGIASILMYYLKIRQIHKYKSWISDFEKYDSDDVCEPFYLILQVFVLGIIAFLPIISSVINLYIELACIGIIGLSVLVAIKTSTKNIIEQGSIRIDLAEAAPDVFKKSEIITFNWFAPVGEKENEWKEIMIQSGIERAVKDRKEVINESQKFKK